MNESTLEARAELLKKGARHEMFHSVVWFICGVVMIIVLLPMGFEEKIGIPWWIGAIVALGSTGYFLLFLTIFLRANAYAKEPIKTKDSKVDTILSLAMVGFVIFLVIASFLDVS